MNAVENSRLGRQIPCIPRWLHYIPRPNDIHSYDRVRSIIPLDLQPYQLKTD